MVVVLDEQDHRPVAGHSEPLFDAFAEALDALLERAVFLERAARRRGHLHQREACRSTGGASRGGARSRAAARGCPWCSRNGRRRPPGAGRGRGPAARRHRRGIARPDASAPRPAPKARRSRSGSSRRRSRWPGTRSSSAHARCALRDSDRPSRGSSCSGSGYESRGWCCRECPRESRAATGRFRTIPDSARECARTSGSSPPEAGRGSSPARARSDSPAPARSDRRCGPPPRRRRRSAG